MDSLAKTVLVTFLFSISLLCSAGVCHSGPPPWCMVWSEADAPPPPPPLRSMRVEDYLAAEYGGAPGFSEFGGSFGFGGSAVLVGIDLSMAVDYSPTSSPPPAPHSASSPSLDSSSPHSASPSPFSPYSPVLSCPQSPVFRTEWYNNSVTLVWIVACLCLIFLSFKAINYYCPFIGTFFNGLRTWITGHGRNGNQPPPVLPTNAIATGLVVAGTGLVVSNTSLRARVTTRSATWLGSAFGSAWSAISERMLTRPNFVPTDVPTEASAPLCSENQAYAFGMVSVVVVGLVGYVAAPPMYRSLRNYWRGPQNAAIDLEGQDYMAVARDAEEVARNAEEVARNAQQVALNARTVAQKAQAMVLNALPERLRRLRLQ